MSSDNLRICGGVSPFSDLTEAEKILTESLTKISTGDGPKLTLGKVHSATKQVVAGSLYKIEADLLDSDGKTKRCNVKIWSRPWLPDGIEVTIECDGEPTVVRKHSA